ncbi:NUDIX pyrophosphatase [Clostridium estertheticum]|uniref:NUDIX hydrolase n=1 Tax=Clostridium estertheticum TaxID=238834 RepID=UPI0013E906BA|nr:NUDIX pyrophosphatase [Clostridium estertheticum]MBZ9687433.1 NUDIX pyrophosphatase [Clostridium estertheticum]
MRQPFNILVFPFYSDSNNNIKYAIFKRSDGDFWQGIAGGVEDEEGMLEAAKRESYEEARIKSDCEFINLDSIASVPATVFDCHLSWGPNVYVVKETSFGVRVNEKNLVISEEHTSFEWFTYEEAIQLLKWDSNKISLWELNQRLLKPKV